MNLGTFSVDVVVQKNGLCDVWISHEGCSGEHYTDVTAEQIGKFLTDEIEGTYEGYVREFGESVR